MTIKPNETQLDTIIYFFEKDMYEKAISNLKSLKILLANPKDKNNQIKMNDECINSLVKYYLFVVKSFNNTKKEEQMKWYLQNLGEDYTALEKELVDYEPVLRSREHSENPLAQYLIIQGQLKKAYEKLKIGRQENSTNQLILDALIEHELILNNIHEMFPNLFLQSNIIPVAENSLKEAYRQIIISYGVALEYGQHRRNLSKAEIEEYDNVSRDLGFNKVEIYNYYYYVNIWIYLIIATQHEPLYSILQINSNLVHKVYDSGMDALQSYYFDNTKYVDLEKSIDCIQILMILIERITLKADEK